MARAVLFPLAAMVLGGCVLTAVGVGVWADTTYNAGVGTQDFEAPLKETWEATLAQLDAMDVSYPKDFKFNFEKGSKMDVKGPKGTTGWIEVTPHPDQPSKYSRVRIRAHGGDNREKKKIAYAVLDGIDARLGGAGDVE